MRTILLMAALAIGACGGSGDPKPDGGTNHDELACNASDWAPVAVGVTCERACVTKPTNYGSGSDTCFATTPAIGGDIQQCDRGTFDADGVRGCCKAASDVTRFWVCQ
jgi:hypothetical protein